GRGDLLDPVVPRVGDEHVPGRVERLAFGVEQPGVDRRGAVAGRGDLPPVPGVGRDRVGGVHLADPVVGFIGYVHRTRADRCIDGVTELGAGGRPAVAGEPARPTRVTGDGVHVVVGHGDPPLGV